MTEVERLVAAAIAELVAEDADLTVTANCTTDEELNRRFILLGNEQTVAVGHADKAQLELLAGQLRAAGLPIPRLLRDKLAAAPGPQAA